MKIKIEGLPMAYGGGGENSAEQAAEAVAKRFGIIVELTGVTSVGCGWPEVNLIGRPDQLVKALFTDDAGWASGDEELDAETLYYAFKEAKPVFG